MAVQLKDAQIRVKLELGDAEDTVESLEKRTEKQRKEAQKDERTAKKVGRETKGKGKTGAIRSALAAGGLVALFQRLKTSLPFGIGTAAAVGMGAAELGQRYGPNIEAMFQELLVKSTGIPMEGFTALSDLGERWRKQKLRLSSLGTAASETIEQGAAMGMGGGHIDYETAKRLFDANRRVAIVMANLAAAGKRAKQTAAGHAVGEVIVGALGSEALDMIQSTGKMLMGPFSSSGFEDMFKPAWMPILDWALDKRRRELDPESFRQGSGR